MSKPRTDRLFVSRLLVLGLLASTGCASNATLVTPRAAQTPLVGMGRVAVMNFQGRDEYAARAQGVVVEQIGQSGLVPLVDGRQLQQSSRWPLYLASGDLNREAALDAARRMGLDTMLVGRVNLLEADGEEFGTKSFRIGDPTVRAVISYQLWDVRSGQTIFDGLAESSTYTGDLDSGRSKAQQKVLEKLCDDAALQLAHRLVPHEMPLEVPLATAMYGKGAAKIRRGNQAAARGDWPAAVVSWQAAIDENPDSHAAWYNLAMAHEARRDFVAAQRCLAAALQRSDQRRYQQAGERIRQAMGEQQTVLAQRARAVGGDGPRIAGPASAGVIPAGYQPPPAPARRLPPINGQPNFGQPNFGQPNNGQPNFGQPGFGQPNNGQPGFGQANPWGTYPAAGY